MREFIIIKGEIIKYRGEDSTLMFPDNVTSIGKNAFSECMQLTEVVIPEGVSCIGFHAFMNCKNLKRVILPQSHCDIEAGAFMGCVNLLEIRMPAEMNHLDDDIFKDCCSIKELRLTAGLTYIGERTFCGCESLQSIQIPETVRNIGNKAFMNCTSLKHVLLSSEISNIGNQAFSFCSSLESISFYEDDPFHKNNPINKFTPTFQVLNPRPDEKYLGYQAFSSCVRLKSIVVPDGIVSINFATFALCGNLGSITLPESITRIDGKAFTGCDNLSDVFFLGDMEEWEKIPIGCDNDCISNAKIHCVDLALKQKEEKRQQYYNVLNNLIVDDFTICTTDPISPMDLNHFLLKMDDIISILQDPVCHDELLEMWEPLFREIQEVILYFSKTEHGKAFVQVVLFYLSEKFADYSEIKMTIDSFVDSIETAAEPVEESDMEIEKKQLATNEIMLDSSIQGENQKETAPEKNIESGSPPTNLTDIGITSQSTIRDSAARRHKSISNKYQQKGNNKSNDSFDGIGPRLKVGFFVVILVLLMLSMCSQKSEAASLLQSTFPITIETDCKSESFLICNDVIMMYTPWKVLFHR